MSNSEEVGLDIIEGPRGTFCRAVKSLEVTSE